MRAATQWQLNLQKAADIHGVGAVTHKDSMARRIDGIWLWGTKVTSRKHIRVAGTEHGQSVDADDILAQNILSGQSFESHISEPSDRSELVRFSSMSTDDEQVQSLSTANLARHDKALRTLERPKSSPILRLQAKIQRLRERKSRIKTHDDRDVQNEDHEEGEDDQEDTGT